MELVDNCEAGRKLLIIDACRNQVLSREGRRKSKGRKIVVESVHENRRSVPKGMAVLFSCESDQFSWEHDELKQSVFSYYLAEYLEGKAGTTFYDDDMMTLDGLIFFVRKRTNDFVFENNLSNDGQSPVLHNKGADWPLSRMVEKDPFFEIRDFVLGQLGGYWKGTLKFSELEGSMDAELTIEFTDEKSFVMTQHLPSSGAEKTKLTYRMKSLDDRTGEVSCDVTRDIVRAGQCTLRLDASKERLIVHYSGEDDPESISTIEIKGDQLVFSAYQPDRTGDAAGFGKKIFEATYDRDDR